MASDLSKYTIGWITALPIELAAATVMLDEEHPEPPLDEHDTTLYTFGSIGRHNVVIACLPGGQTGLSAATAAAIQMSNKFKFVKHGFMVGIGGGVPSEKADIRLGDVVVSLPNEDNGGVVQYDFGRAEAGGRFHPTGHLNTPPKLLLAVVNLARSNCILGRSKHATHLENFSEDVFCRSSAGPDMLFQPAYSHAGRATCKDCNSEMLVKRTPRISEEPSDRAFPVRIHFGTIASGNQVIKDARKRDEISERLGGHILCFEMEAAGLMNIFPCLVVRGICDYADSHKQDRWQGYAAATAAAYAKELILLIPTAHASSSVSIRLLESASSAEKVHFYVRFDRNTNFVGRDSILLHLAKLMSPLSPNTRAAIWGLGGCGKTAVALEFVYRVHTREPHRTIFWIRASDRDHYKKAFRDIAILYGIPGARDLEKDILDAVRTKLADKNTPRWLIVLDNVDDPDVLLSEGDSGEQRLRDYIPSRAGCKVLFTTRDKQAAHRLIGTSGPVLEVESFGHVEAQQLLVTIVSDAEFAKDGCIERLLIELTYLPLAIVQAAAFIRENDIDVEEYLSLLREQDAEDESTDVLGQEFEDESRYPRIGNALTKTWHISFKQLERQNYLAFECLKHLACLGCSDIPETLIMPLKDVPRLGRVKVIGTLVGYQFLVRQRQGDLFDTHRLIHLATKRWLWSKSAWKTCVQSAVDILCQRIPHGGYQKYNVYSRYLPHGICLLGHFGNKNMEETEASIDLMSQIAACQRDLGDHSGAERSHRAVLLWRGTHSKKHERKTLQSMQDVGQDLMMKGQYEDAELVHRKTFRLRFQHLGPADAETLTSMRNIAEALGFQGKWEEYEILSIELAKLSRAWLGMAHTVTLSCLKALSICYCRRRWFKLAEKLARDVVDGRKQADRLGEVHPSTLKGISHLALVLGYSGKWEEAGEQELRASMLLEDILGPRHPDTLTSKCNLARIWVHLDMPAAEKLFQDIYEVRLDVLGHDHPDTLKSLNYVSRFCKHHGLTDTARLGLVNALSPKQLVSTDWWNESDPLDSVSELNMRLSKLPPLREHPNSVEPLTKVDDEEIAIIEWSLPRARTDRTKFVWSKSEHDATYWIPLSVLEGLLENLELIDATENWSWFKRNSPGLQSLPSHSLTPKHPQNTSSWQPGDLVSEVIDDRPIRRYGVDAGSRSSAHSIFRATLISARTSANRD